MWKAVTFDEAANKRIREAAKQELRLRIEGVIGVPVRVGPFRLLPLSMLGVLEMQYAENRLVCGGVPKADDLLQFLYVVSPCEEKKNQRRFFKRAGKLLRDSAVFDEVKAYFEIQFNDMPSSGSSKGSPDAATESRSFVMHIADTLCHEYGWSFDQVLKTSVPVAMQLHQRIIFRASGGRHGVSNPITQRAKAIELERLTQQG